MCVLLFSCIDDDDDGDFLRNGKVLFDAVIAVSYSCIALCYYYLFNFLLKFSSRLAK
jgi:hypothetical protein